MKRKIVMTLPLPSDQTLEISERAVIDLEWKITGQNEVRLRAKQGMTLTSHQMYVTCEVDPKSVRETLLYVQVESHGYGPIVGRQVDGKLNAIRSRVELLVRRAGPKEEPRMPMPATLPRSAVSKTAVEVAELEQYADLHDQGVLSDDEYSDLKRQWLHALEA